MSSLFCDLHVHSSLSDGCEPPDQVAHTARSRGISVIALSDHNCLNADLARQLSHRYGITVLPACEFTAMTRLRQDSRDREVHVIGLFLQETDDIRRVLQINQPDRRPYVMAYLMGLNALGVDLSGDGSHDLDLAYDRLLAENADSHYIGRQHIARRMVALGYAADLDEAYHKYIGRYPGEEQRVAVRSEDYLRYASLEEVLAAIRSCPGAVSVLCHPYYRLEQPEQQVEELVRRFQALGGDAMEVFYGSGRKAYTPQQRARLIQLSLACRLLPSAGSDHHGDDTPMVRGAPFIYRKLLQRHDELLLEG